MTRRIWLLAAMVAAAVQVSAAGIIGSADIPFLGIAVQGTVPPPFAATLSLSPASDFFCAADPASCVPMLDHTFTTADAGITYAVNAGTSPNFPQIVAMLTDGLPDNISLWGPVVDFVFPVQPVFFPNSGGPDFHGFIVDEIDFTIASVSIVQIDLPFGPLDPTTGTVSGFTFTLLTEDISIAVQGTPTPEPATAAGLGAGLALLSLLGARKARHSSRQPFS